MLESLQKRLFPILLYRNSVFTLLSLDNFKRKSITLVNKMPQECLGDLHKKYAGFLKMDQYLIRNEEELRHLLFSQW